MLFFVFNFLSSDFLPWYLHLHIQFVPEFMDAPQRYMKTSFLKLNLSEKLWIHTYQWWNRNICMNESWRGLECRERGNEFSFLEASKPSVTCLSVPACPNAAYATGITFPHIYDTSLLQQQQRKVWIEKVVSYPARWSFSFILGPLQVGILSPNEGGGLLQSRHIFKIFQSTYCLGTV